jgi:hypothetical protein
MFLKAWGEFLNLVLRHVVDRYGRPVVMNNKNQMCSSIVREDDRNFFALGRKEKTHDDFSIM